MNCVTRRPLSAWFPARLQTTTRTRILNNSHRGVHIEKRLVELGITLPPAPKPKANYNIVCYAGGGSDQKNKNILYVSGHLPLQTDGTLLTGRIGPESGDGKSVAHGYEAARHVGLNIIATLKEQLGDLDRVEQIIKVRQKKNRVVQYLRFRWNFVC